MTKKKKIIITLVIIFAIIIVGGFVIAQKSKKQLEYTTHKVEKTTLKQTVDATGRIESAEKIDLNFKTTGRISNIYFEVGSKVKAGQILAKLGANALASSIDNARAQVNQMIADYDKLLAGASAEDINISKNTAEQKQQDLISAENNLKNLKLKRNTELLNLKDTAINYLNNEIIIAQNAINEVNNTLNDTDAQTTLSILDNNKLSLAEINQELSQQLINKTKIIIFNINNYSENAEILSALDELKNTLNLVVTTLDNTSDVLRATLTSNNLTETELDTLKSNIIAKQTSVSTAKINIQNAKSNWTNKIIYYQEQITIYEDAVLSAQKFLAIANSQLNFKKTPPRAFEIEAVKAKIDSARANLKLAQANLNQTIIKAPINGTIIKKNYNLGEQTSLVSAVLEMIGESNLQIEVDIPESDIAKIKILQEAEITLDAFGDEEIFSGKVIFVDPTETTIQDVVYYKVKIQLDNLSYNLKPGMTANVIILTNKKESVLVVPSRAIKSTNGDKYVEVLINNIPEQRIVTTGMRGDDGIEIISGINEGEEVVVFVKN